MKEEKKDVAVYLDDILKSVEKIRLFTKGMDKGKFSSNGLVFDATLRNLEIIGEAASKLPVSFRDKHADVEWRKIIGTRNRLIHGYDDVNADIVWAVIESDLPLLEEKIRKLKQ